MLTLLKNLVAHNGDATEVMVKEVLASDAATADPEIRALCNHILVSNRFWSAAIRGVPFDVGHEVTVGCAPEHLCAAFRVVQDDEVAWLAAAAESDCLRQIDHPLIPGGGCSVVEAFTQVCMHSHGHRAQLMKLLRRHGVEPAPHDFIEWLVGRPRAVDGSGRTAG